MVMSSVEQSQAGTASGINNSVSRIASLLAVAVFGVILFYIFDARLRQELERLPVDQAAEQQIYEQRNRLTQIQLPRGLDGQQKEQARREVDESFLFACRSVMPLSALLSGLSALVALLTLEHARPLLGPARRR